MAESSMGKTIAKVIAGCMALITGLTLAGVILFLAVVVGQNQVMGSEPTDIDTTFVADVGGTALSEFSYDDQLSGEGAHILQDMVAQRSSASLNPFAIMSYNFDYHVTGSARYEVTLWARPEGVYNKSYNVRQSGHTFLWRENGAAFAQVRKAEYDAQELADALRPHIHAQ